MPSQYTPVCVLHRDAAAAASGSNPGRSAGAELPAPIAGLLELDPAGGTALFARLVELGHDVQVAQVVLVPIGGGVTDDEPAFLVAANGDDSWTVTNNLGQTIRTANGTFCIRDRSLVRTAGALLVTEPIVSLALDGATLALWVTPPTGFSVRVWTRPRNWASPSVTQHAGYRDPATTSTAAFLDEQLALVSTRAGAGFQVQASAVPLPITAANFALDCVFASSGPLGAVWLDASDVGASTPTKTNVPTDLAANTPQAFQRYPSSFYRRATFGRGVLAAAPVLGARASDSIVTVAGVPTLYVTNADVLASRWLLQIDGVAIDVVILHDTIAGLRRPLDIWNLVIVPAIARNLPLDVWNGADVVGKIGRLEWLESARFLGGWRDVELTVRAYAPFGQVGMPVAP